jgi:hypothetical protein
LFGVFGFGGVVDMFAGISQGFGVLGFEMKGESGQFILVWWEGIGKFFEFPQKPAHGSVRFWMF